MNGSKTYRKRGPEGTGTEDRKGDRRPEAKTGRDRKKGPEGTVSETA